MNFIPKSKCDHEAVQFLRNISDTLLLQNIDKVMQWIGDINWPIANEIIEIFIKRFNVIQRTLIKYLTEVRDAGISYSILYMFYLDSDKNR